MPGFPCHCEARLRAEAIQSLLQAALDCFAIARNDEKQRIAERRQTRSPTAMPFGARRALKRQRAACRRSTAALAAASERHSSTPATRFLGRVRGGCYPPFPVSQSSDIVADRSSCRPGVMRRNRPGAKVTSPRPQEPHPAPSAGVTRRTSFHVSEIRCGIHRKQ